MTRKEFEKLVRNALKALPKRFKEKLRNVDVVIEDGAKERALMGLYEGVPLKDRTQEYSLAMPDKITLFKRNIETECGVRGLDVQTEIGHVIQHEIAHHFGISDERLEDMGVY
ncbi:MAG: metallopeptidase family protein [Candidatus Omnitrophica bacterium]|nr:metallopeptidase family protein [Candidatus Omnitrophota bacterium]